jgi:hypothetical protein
MADFTGENLSGSRFVRVDLSESEFYDADLSRSRFRGVAFHGVVMSGVELGNVRIDGEIKDLVINGVDVVPLVEAELDRRFPGRADRRAEDPAGLRVAWSGLERTWAETLERVAAMPAGTVDTSVGGEWSFAQTLRHLVMATDTWLGRTVLELDEPYHPLGVPHADYATDGYDISVFTTTVPSYPDVLEARRSRVTMVRDFLASVTADGLADIRTSPWDPAHRVTVLHCLHVILDEEWEHHRYAVRDLDAIDVIDLTDAD